MDTAGRELLERLRQLNQDIGTAAADLLDGQRDGLPPAERVRDLARELGLASVELYAWAEARGAGRIIDAVVIHGDLRPPPAKTSP
ncbi:hypothetical protein [Prauserella flavalba]|uniref:hypothetical protein n=1 Tax=Prauserella flavalba TaxID=1477506 RepID=UPI0036E483B3